MPKVTQRQADLAVLSIQLLATLFIVLNDVLNRAELFSILVATVTAGLYTALLLAYWHGWQPARRWAVILLTILVGFGLPEPFITQYAPFILLLPPVLALVLAGPSWVIGSTVGLVLILLVRAGGQGVYANPATLTMVAMIIGALVLSRLVSDSNQQRAQQQTDQLAQQEEALRLSEQRFRALIENTSDGIVVFNVNNEITYRSPSMEKMSGFRNSERLGHVGADRVHPDDLSNFIATIEAVKSEPGAIRTLEYRSQHQSGEWHWVEVTFVNQLHEASVQGVVVNIRNITRRKQAEAELANRNEEIRNMSQQLWQSGKLATMGELAASLAHELNNPLATVSLRIESLLAQTPPDSPNLRPLTIVAQEAERMSKLVHNLLQFSHPHAQEFAPVDIRDEIANSLELIEYLLTKHNVTVVQTFDQLSPLIQADRQQLRQLLLNFFTNAVDAMPQGGTLTIQTAPNPDQTLAILKIADTGVGIQPHDLSRAFEPFFTTKPEGQGTGLGLMICRRIVQAHQGTLELSSPGLAGQGTLVTVTFPAVPTAQPAGTNLPVP